MLVRVASSPWWSAREPCSGPSSGSSCLEPSSPSITCCASKCPGARRGALVSIGVGLDPEGGVRTSSEGQNLRAGRCACSATEALPRSPSSFPEGKQTYAMHFVLGEASPAVRARRRSDQLPPALPFSELLKSSAAISEHEARREGRLWRTSAHLGCCSPRRATLTPEFVMGA